LAEKNWPLWPTKPMLARIAREPFSDPQWVYEVKWDGVRCLLHLQNGRARLQSRSLKDMTRTYPELADAPHSFEAASAVVDGEIVAIDASGKPSFHTLQERIHLVSQPEIEKASKRIPVTFYAFDLLYLDGRPLMGEPLELRKFLLRSVLTESKGIRYSDHVEGEGEAFYGAATRMRIEGIMAKRKNGIYQPGFRSPDWLKIRIETREDLVIGGWTPGRGGRSGSFGALLLGEFREGNLHYVGKVGTGFDRRDLVRLRKKLLSLEISRRPFVEDPGEADARWTRPELVCEVRLSGRTPRGIRFPVFMGLRPDKAPWETGAQPRFGEAPDIASRRRRRQVGYGDIRLSNPRKVLWAHAGYTKTDLLQYYLDVAGHLLPYVRDRPLTLYRQPDGVSSGGFYQRNLPPSAPKWARTAEISNPGRAAIRSILCQDRRTLAWLANLGCTEIHPWLSRIDRPERPDLIALDLDPVEPARYEDACHVAILFHDALEEIGLRTFVKTSGKRGLHVLIPIRRELTYDQTRAFASELGRRLSPRLMGLLTMGRRNTQKTGRVFFDPAQNGWGRTLAAPYSLRSTQEATVSTPITWEECRTCVNPLTFTIRTVPRRLEALGDPWQGILKNRQSLTGVLSGG